MAHNPRFKGKTTYILRIGWLKMMSLCPHSGTLRWHTHTAYTAYIKTPNCGICKGCFLGSILPFKNARFEQFLGIRASQSKIKGGKKPFFRNRWLKMMRLCSNSGTLRWHTHTHHLVHIDPECEQS